MEGGEMNGGKWEGREGEVRYDVSQYKVFHFSMQDPYDTDRHQSVESAKLIEYLNSRASASPNLTTVPVLAVSYVHTMPCMQTPSEHTIV